MYSRRLERANNIVRQTVSDAIQNHLSDPRIRGLISVTRVQTSADMHTAHVYLSMLGIDEREQKLSLRGIRHAKGYIQSLLAARLTTKTCPTLSFHLDDSLKKGFEIGKLIDQVTSEMAERQDDEDDGENREESVGSRDEG